MILSCFYSNYNYNADDSGSVKGIIEQIKQWKLITNMNMKGKELRLGRNNMPDELQR